MDDSGPDTLLRFCIDCGQGVSPYGYATVEYELEYMTGDTPSDDAGVVTYSCSCRPGAHLAPNMINTGIGCPKCNAFMNMFVRFCGGCGHALH